MVFPGIIPVICIFAVGWKGGLYASAFLALRRVPVRFLLLLVESDSYTPIFTLPCLRSFLVKARYEPKFFIHVSELEQHLDHVKRMQSIVEKLCLQRIDLYKKLDEQDEPDEQ